MNLIVDVFGKSIEIHKDMPVYFSIRNEFLAYKKRLLDEFAKCNIRSKDIDVVHESMLKSFEKIANDVICKLSEHDIYDKTKKDLIDTNVGYVEWLNAILKYYEKAVSVQNSADIDAQRQIIRAEADAQSSITGLGFGIVTSDILSMWIYDSMNESEVKRQTKRAQEQYDMRRQSIQRVKDSTIKSQMDQFIKSELEPMLKKAIDKFVSCLLSQYVNALDVADVIDLKCIEGLDEVRALEILQNFSVVSNQKGLIAKSIELCPYHFETYVLASKNKIFSEDLGKVIRFFGLHQEFQNYIEKSIIDMTSGVNSISRVENLISEYCRYLVYVTEKTYEDIMKEQLNVLSQNKLMELKEVVINARNMSLEDKASYLVDHSLIFIGGTTDQSFFAYLNGIVDETDMGIIEKYCDKNVWNTISDWANSNIDNYSKLRNYLIKEYDTCIVEYEIESKKRQDIKRKEDDDRREQEAKIKEAQEVELQRKIMKQKADEKARKIKIILGLSVIASVIILTFIILHRPFVQRDDMQQYLDAVYVSNENEEDYLLYYNNTLCTQYYVCNILQYKPLVGTFVVDDGYRDEYRFMINGSIIDEQHNDIYTRYERENIEVISITQNPANSRMVDVSFFYNEDEEIKSFYVGAIFLDRSGKCIDSNLCKKAYTLIPNAENKVIINDSYEDYNKIVIFIAEK